MVEQMILILYVGVLLQNPNTMCNQLTAGNVEDYDYSWTWK